MHIFMQKYFTTNIAIFKEDFKSGIKVIFIYRLYKHVWYRKNNIINFIIEKI